MLMNKKGLRQFTMMFLITVLMISGLSFSVPAQAVEGKIFASEEMITVSFRVEGSSGSIFPKSNVQVPAGSTVFDVMDEALYESGIYFDATEGEYAYVVQIGDDRQGRFGVWDGWQYMVNDIKPVVGIGEYPVQAHDDIYFYYGNIGDIYEGRTEADHVDKLTLTPEIELVPAQPIAGQDLQVKITAKYNRYGSNFDLIEADIETEMANAAVFFNGQNYLTDMNGMVTIPAPEVIPGSFELKVSKDVAGSYPRLIRSTKAIQIGVAQFEENEERELQLIQ